jgi:hypothetical protein
MFERKSFSFHQWKFLKPLTIERFQRGLARVRQTFEMCPDCDTVSSRFRSRHEISASKIEVSSKVVVSGRLIRHVQNEEMNVQKLVFSPAICTFVWIWYKEICQPHDFL